MRGRAASRKDVGTRLLRAGLLVFFSALMFFVTRLSPDFHGSVWKVTAVGFLLLAGTLTADLLEPLGLPHLTGYLLAGVLAGPYVLRLVDEETVRGLSPVNTLSLSLIALAGGVELEWAAMRKSARSLGWSMVLQCLLVLIVTMGAFYAVRPLLPFTRGLGPGTFIGLALLWGALSVSRSPSATLAVLSQTRATGPLASYTLAFVMSSNLVVVVLLAAVLAIARPLLDPASSFSVDSFVTLGHELFGSVALGTTIGLFIAVYVRLIDRHMLIVLLILGFGVTTLLDYIRFDSLLSFMVAGFIVRNMSRQGKRFVEHINQAGSVVYIVFFATAGADLDVPLLRGLWPVALLLGASRAFATWGAARLSARLAKDPLVLRSWSWSGLVAQAGLALGLVVVVTREFPSFGTAFGSLVIATIGVNEVIGPVLFKLALDRAGETSQVRAPSFPSMRPPPMDGGAGSPA
jgi:Kef-type K+ transport system membrane component KefB